MIDRKYAGAMIINIHWHRGALHAQIVTYLGELLVSATLDHCVKVIYERTPKGLD